MININNFFFTNPITRSLFIIGVLANFLVWYLWLTKINPISYQIYIPLEIPVESLRVYSLPILGSFFTIINFILAYIALKKEILISLYLLSTSILIQVLILVLVRHYLLIF